MLENFQDQHRVERPVWKRQNRIHVYHRKPVASRFAKIVQIDIAPDTLQSCCHQCSAVRAKTATEIQNGWTGIALCKTHQSAIVFARFSRQPGSVEIVSRANHLLRFGIINALMGIRHRYLLAASFLYLAIANVVWIARDTRPPFWDMAGHQIGALRIYDTFVERGIRALAAVPRLTEFYPLGFYPPFYHSIVAVFYGVFGKHVDAAQWANLPAIAILLIATYGIGRTLLNPIAAAGAASLANFYPLMLWLSRETIIDYWLTSMVALAIWLLIRTNEFENRKRSVVFGVICGFGMLTKWTFPFFVVLPAAWFARKNPKNAALAAGIAASIAAYWYVPAARGLAQFQNINSAGGITEGDPGR